MSLALHEGIKEKLGSRPKENEFKKIMAGVFITDSTVNAILDHFWFSMR
jgi:hypothetical protein